MRQKESPYRFDGRRGYGALGLLMLASLWGTAGYAQGATAASDAAPPPLTKVETTRVCQLTGQYDEVLDQPTANETWARFRLGGTDLGPSFLHQGRLWFLFGDAMPTGPQENNGLNHACGDAVAYAIEPQRSTCPRLDFVTHPGRHAHFSLARRAGRRSGLLQRAHRWDQHQGGHVCVVHHRDDDPLAPEPF